jgi:transitional endoplasmic reticulum ATPase
VFDRLDLDVHLLKVISVDVTASVAYVRANAGGEGTVTGPSVENLAVGETYVMSSDGSIESAPEGLWIKKRRVVVCKRVLETTIIVRLGLETLALDKPSELDIAEGNTLEIDEDDRIIGILDAKPVSTNVLDNDAIGAHSDFKVEHEELTDSLDDFGGFEDIKRRASTLVLMPLQRRELLESVGIKPVKGVLFTGPPGTGKTLMAKILAKESGATFFEISGPEIFGSLYGESEQTLRKIFDDAKCAAPSIIFFDEIDSLAGNRSSDSHEVSKRVVAQLLTLMDGFEPSTNVLIIAATNRIDELDPALRRPGRFDADIEFRLPTEPEREAVLRASRPTGASEDLPIENLVEATEGWSSAEVASIWTEAGLSAVSDWRGNLDVVDLEAGLARARDQHLRRPRST